MGSNEQKYQTLGMPYGTAAHKLRKKIIYALISGTLLAVPYCYKCAGRIHSEEDMTIEHIKPWEGRENGATLFWDIENIAFSHRWCNRPHVAVLNPKPMVHGSHNTYDRKGCRCDECVQAKKNHNLERYQDDNCRSSTKAV